MCRMACFACSVLLLSAAVAGADEAEDAFQTLFGAEYKKATATPDKADDVALAAKLLAAAKSKDTVPALAALLCEKAYELGVKAPFGYAAAVEAMELLADTVADKAASCQDKIVAVRQREYDAAKGPERAKAGAALLDAVLAGAGAWESAGGFTEATALLRRAQALAQAVAPDRKPEIQARTERIAIQQKVRKQAADLKARVQANPQDGASRKELVRLLVVELDTPAAAAAFLDDSLDEAMRKYVPAAAKGIEAAPEAACLELANWYLALSEKAVIGKQALLVRASAYYEKYLDLHKADDVTRSQASLALKKAEETLSKLGAKSDPTPKAGRWVEILRFADPAKDTVEGKWERSKEGFLIMRPNWYTRLAMPCVVEGNYEFSVTFARTDGDVALNLIFPVGSAAALMYFGGGGGMLESKSQAERLMPGVLQNNQDYTAEVKVTVEGETGEISAQMNGKPYMHWQGPLSDLRDPGQWKMPVRQMFGFGAHQTTMAIKSVKLRLLSGKAKLTR